MHGKLPTLGEIGTLVTAGSRKRRFIIYALVLIAVAGALYYVFGSSATQQRRAGRFGADNGPVPVLAAAAALADVPVYLDAVGTTKALNTVTVRPQVDGKLLSVGFKEGQDVKKGDVLAQIDPTTFQAALDQAVAKKAQDQALLNNAQNDLTRYEQLAATNAINRQQSDTQKSLVAQYTAQVQSDQAAIESAQATLNYATVKAPIDGRTGIRAVDHCVEGFCSLEANPYADAQAIRGLTLLTRGLTAVKADPSNIQARLDCQIGSWLSMGPLASGVPMGASHGIGYVLGAVHDIPHGHTSCIMLPAVMRWNKDANADRQAEIATAMGHPGDDAGDVLDRFIGGLGMPRSLSAVGVGEDAFARISEQAMGTPWIPRNPRKIAGPAEVRGILELAA